MTNVDESKRLLWMKMQADTASLHPKKDEPDALNGDGGGGTFDGMIPIKDYVDARDDAVESRLVAKLDKLPTAESLRNNIWGAALTIVLLLLAVAAFAGDRFDSGLSIAEQRQEQLKRDNAQDAAVSSINKKLDLLIVGQAKAGKIQEAQASK